jgi:outer membrane protein TolC
MRLSLFFSALLAASVLALSGDARADEGADSFVREVLARSPALRSDALRRDAFRQEARAAGTWPDPSVNVMVDRIPNGMVEMPMIRYQLSQMVMWPGKLGLMRSAVERQGDAAAADVDTRRIELRLAAQRGYAMLRLNVKQREVNRANRNLATTIANAALGRYSSGVGGHHEVARAQVEVNALDVELVKLEGERTSMVAMLNALRDQPVDMAIADPKPLAPSQRADFSLASLTEQAIRDRPELRNMRAMQDESVAMADLARKEPYPDFMGSVWFNQMLGGPNTMGFMVGATIPVFGVSRGQHRAAAFDSRADSAAQAQASMRAMIRYEVSSALTRVQTSARQLELIDSVALPKTRESFDASIAGYGASTVDLVGLLDARRALQTAELTRAEAQATLEVAWAELERAVAGPVQGGTP